MLDIFNIFLYKRQGLESRRVAYGSLELIGREMELATKDHAFVVDENGTISRLEKQRANSKTPHSNHESLPIDDDSYPNDSDGAGWRERGRVLFNSGHDERAIDALHCAVAIDENDRVAWKIIALVNCLGTTRIASKALSSSTRALELDQTDGLLWYCYGRANSGLMGNSDDEALAAYLKAVALDDTLSFAWTSLGYTFFKLDRFDEAIGALNHAVELDRADNLAPLVKARIFEAQGRLDDAFNSCETLVGIFEGDALAWMYMADLACARGAYEQAKKAYWVSSQYDVSLEPFALRDEGFVQFLRKRALLSAVYGLAIFGFVVVATKYLLR